VLTYVNVEVVKRSRRQYEKSVPEDDRIVVNPMPLPPKQSHRRLQLHRNRNRREEVGFQEATGLAEIRQAMEAMTLRSCSGSESESGVRRLMRHSSLETVNTNVTSADEFVWIDSHSRLVEVQHLPWSNHEILRVLQNGRLDEAVERISMDVIPRLSYLLQRGLVRIAIEIQRFSRQLGLTSKQEVHSAFKVILAPALAHSCIQACFRAAAMLGGEAQFRLCKSSRAGLHFSIGRFHRWMCDVRLGKFIHEYAAIYLTAGLENLLEEIMIQCMPSNGSTMTAIGLEHSIANNGELWGLLQPYSHLNTGRTASGELAMPRWPSSLSDSDAVYFSYGNDKAAEQSLLTTCVGSIWELKNLLNNITPPQRPRTKQIVTWSTCALETLFYFMRCSQLEHTQQCTRPIQELVYEKLCDGYQLWPKPYAFNLGKTNFDVRNSALLAVANDVSQRAQISCWGYKMIFLKIPWSSFAVTDESFFRPYAVLPPLIEWVRIATAHCEHCYRCVIDKDDVMQAARLLLPGVDCPVRHDSYGELFPTKSSLENDSCSQWKTLLAFRMVAAGRVDLVPTVIQLLPSTKLNTLDDNGLTPLMLACLKSDEHMVRTLLKAGANINIETPPSSTSHPNINPQYQMWTALTYATLQGNMNIVKMLLENGATVEGGSRLNEEKMTVTPLQLAAAVGNLDLINELLLNGAQPFLTTVIRDSMSYGKDLQQGCYSPFSVAAAHGQRMVLHKLLSNPYNNASKDILSLEEILAEANNTISEKRKTYCQVMPLTFDESKTLEIMMFLN
uniref:ABTB2/3 histone-like domain-containing protein n=1 Tax=Strigamia maritima TaxID=126957 RepID=T1JAW8_STRMM